MAFLSGPDAAAIAAADIAQLFLDAGGGVRQALLPPVRILRGHDPLDRAKTVVETPRQVVKFVEKLLVRARDRRRLLPLGHIVEHQPGQSDEQDRTDDQR